MKTNLTKRRFKAPKRSSCVRFAEVLALIAEIDTLVGAFKSGFAKLASMG